MAECAFDRDLLLRLRALALEEPKPPDLGLCQAQVDGSAFEADTKGNKGKSKKVANASGASESQKEREGRPSSEGGSGGTSGGEFPWRRGRSADGEGGSGSAPSGLAESCISGTGATTDVAPWRRSPPSPELRPQEGGGGQPPWRKSPPGTSSMPSPSLSIQDPDLPEGALEFEISIDQGTREPFSAVTKHASEIAQKNITETTQQPNVSGNAGDLDSEEFESGDDEDDECGEEAETGKGATQNEETQAESWKSNGWKSRAKEDSGPPLPCDMTVSPTPPPPLQSLAGAWFDTLGNMIQVPLYPPMAWFTSNSGTTERQLSLDKWGRLWCGNGVLHAVGYNNSGPMSQDMPPSHLSWRTTAWKFSVWERVAAPPSAPAPPATKGKGNNSRATGKGGGRSGGTKRGGATLRNKGDSGDNGQATAPARAPEMPKLADFMSFPALGKAEPKKKTESKAQA